MRRAEEDLREAKQVDRKPDGFSSNRDAIGQGSSAISGVPKSTPVRSRRAGYAVLAAVVAVGGLIASIYARDQAEKHSAEANAALTVAQLARQDAEKARIAAEERMLAATRQAEAERRQAEADRAATKLADERAKKEALQQKKEAEERLRVEQAPAQREIATKKAAADAKAKAEQIEQIAAQRELTAKAKMRGVLPPCVGSFDMSSSSIDQNKNFNQNPEIYVAQCVFQNDQFNVMYLVTNYGRIIAVNPLNGQWQHIGYSTPPRLPNVAWSYDLPNANWSYPCLLYTSPSPRD